MSDESSSSEPEEESKGQKKPDKYTVVITPVRPTSEVVEGKEEVLEVIRQHAAALNVPEHAIATCGLFKVFKGEEAGLSCQETQIDLLS